MKKVEIDQIVNYFNQNQYWDHNFPFFDLYIVGDDYIILDDCNRVMVTINKVNGKYSMVKNIDGEQLASCKSFKVFLGVLAVYIENSAKLCLAKAN